MYMDKELKIVIGSIVILSFIAVMIPTTLWGIIPACGGISYEYSKGERVGVITKVSQKGLYWKTYEGEMNLGGFENNGNGSMVPVCWAFSVTNKDVLNKIQKSASSGSKVTLEYIQPFIMGFNTGSSGYLVTGIKE